MSDFYKIMLTCTRNIGLSYAKQLGVQLQVLLFSLLLVSLLLVKPIACCFFCCCYCFRFSSSRTNALKTIVCTVYSIYYIEYRKYIYAWYIRILG